MIKNSRKNLYIADYIDRNVRVSPVERMTTPW